jgi:hypothetical protein
VAALPSVRVGRKRSSSQGIRCDYIGSATNLVGICIHVKSDEYVREEKTDEITDDGICTHADHGDDDDADAVRGAVRAGAVREPQGDGGAEAGGARLRPADG